MGSSGVGNRSKICRNQVGWKSRSKACGNPSGTEEEYGVPQGVGEFGRNWRLRAGYGELDWSDATVWTGEGLC